MKHYLFLTVLLIATGLLVQCTSEEPEMDPESGTVENQGMESGQLQVPGEWEVRLDQTDPEVEISSDTASADIYFVNMEPGWHITSGPAAIYWNSDQTANGDYRASAQFHLFDPGQRREAFGLFFGGENLNEDNQSYLYFLLRNGGQYLVKKRSGSETETLRQWTDTEAMNSFTGDSPSVANTLAVEVHGDSLSFFVNDERVHSMAKGDHVADGIVGLRVNHALNLHVQDLQVEQN